MGPSPWPFFFYSSTMSNLDQFRSTLDKPNRLGQRRLARPRGGVCLSVLVTPSGHSSSAGISPPSVPVRLLFSHVCQRYASCAIFAQCMRACCFCMPYHGKTSMPKTIAQRNPSVSANQTALSAASTADVPHKTSRPGGDLQQCVES